MVSIITPVYKVEPYLARCVESLRSQTFQDIEIILVDDGSPDNCPRMCDEFAAVDPRIRVIHKKNGGVCSARNAGLDAARGEYITFVDSDDWLDPGMYETMMAQNCDVVLCDCIKEHPGKQELYTHNIRPGFYDRTALEQEYFPHLLMMENMEYPATISNWLLLFRRELAADIRYLTGVRYSEDLLFGAQLMYRARSFYYLKGQAFYHYRMNPQSATHKFVPDKWNDYLILHAGIQKAFSNCNDFDFSRQIDWCLLFFLYNAMGDILCAKQLSHKDRESKVYTILKNEAVREMFCRLKIRDLPIPIKQKIITWMYKHPRAVNVLCMYYEHK